MADGDESNGKADSGKSTTALKRDHSANSWESAELGDDERKKKFLKLMGANKKTHGGRFVIGDSNAEHGRTKEESEEITDKIEGIYKQGMEHKLTGAARRHRGLGYIPGDLTPVQNKIPECSAELPQDTPKGVEHLSVPKSKIVGFCKAGTLAEEKEQLKLDAKETFDCDDTSVIEKDKSCIENEDHNSDRVKTDKVSRGDLHTESHRDENRKNRDKR